MTQKLAELRKCDLSRISMRVADGTLIEPQGVAVQKINDILQ